MIARKFRIAFIILFNYSHNQFGSIEFSKTIRDETITLTPLYVRTEELVERIEQKVYPLLETYVAEVLAKGEKVAFADNLQASSDGLHADGRDLAWTDLDGYRVGGGKLTIFSHPNQHEWFSLSLPQIDNIPVLINLLKAQEKNIQS